MKKEDIARRRYLCHTLPLLRRQKMLAKEEIKVSDWLYARVGTIGRDPLWSIFSHVGRDHGKENLIGQIKRHKKYAFFPEKGVVLDAICLQDLAVFLEGINTTLDA